MANIQILDQTTINQIAAGEVIERPASVVKELVENAIDAKATAITIEIKDGGISFIRITDNGCGISADEIPLAFLRHSTSKIRSVEDLLLVSSLGFRGEALSSIGAVAQVELITKTPTALNGARYVYEGGEEKGLEEIGAPEGTTFLVRNLFYNTPARRKFLKTAQTEGGYISEMTERIALSHPEVSIRFINHNQSRLHTSGNNNVKDIIYHIYGRDITSNLLKVEEELPFGRIDGYIGKPVISRGNRAFENYYINGRYIKSSIIAKAIEDAYQPYLMQHKYPFTVLHVTIRPELLDVNVHPSKMELRFSNGEEIYQGFTQVIQRALSKKELIPEVTLGKASKEDAKPASKEDVKALRPPEPFEKNRIAMESRPGKARVLEPVGYEGFKRPEEPVPEQPGNYMGGEAAGRSNESAGPIPQVMSRAEKGQIEKNVQLELFDGKLLSREAKDSHRIIGQLFDTYWMVEYQDKLFMIDQHAAHEKVLFERTMNTLKTREYTSQLLNPPMIITLGLKEENLLKENLAAFREIGFEIDHFGGREYALSAVPDNLFGIARKDIFLEMLDELSNEVNGQKKELVLQKIASMSCKAAVKGNHSLKREEAESLIDELLTLENPYHCPHGRPTIISMSKTEIERKFKRII